jgi:hypothetical protein
VTALEPPGNHPANNGPGCPPRRFWLLRILMDTPVKFSYTACLTGWFLEMDKKRGTPQMFVMSFERLETALGRLKKIP